MNESTQCVRADHAQQPQDHQQNGYSPEHRYSFRGHLVLLAASNSRKCTQAKLRQVSSKGPSRGAISLYFAADSATGERILLDKRRDSLLNTRGQFHFSIHVDNSIAHGIEREIRNRMQVEFAHEVGAVSFGRLHAQT
jgi:hypothetical protein